MVSELLQSKWFTAQVEREASREVLSLGERIGEAMGLVISVIFIAFVAIHQTRPTGFFIGDSVGTDAAIIYIVVAIGMVPAALRLVLGRRNMVRPLEAFGMAAFGAAAVYFLITFPFDMSRFAQPLPRSLEFLIDWIPESLAKAMLVIGLIACAFFAPFTYRMHVSVKRYLAEEERPEPSSDPSET
jgi:type IV secretory pathway VirB2 component (pilin)